MVAVCENCGGVGGIQRGICANCRNASLAQDQENEAQETARIARERLWRVKVGGPKPQYTWKRDDGQYISTVTWRGKVVYTGSFRHHAIMLTDVEAQIERIVNNVLAGKPVGAL